MDKTKHIREVFNKIPNYYDIMNDSMSLGLHRIWKKKLINMIDIVNKGNYLDLSTGSGDIAKLVLQKTMFLNINMTCADPDSKMLEKAKEKLINSGFIRNINYIQTEAEQMPFYDNSFDVVTLSFGLRNFSNIEQGLSEVFRVLKPNGKLYCLEFSPEMDYKLLQKGYNKYLDILPKIGKFIAKDEQSYSYLAESIKNFKTRNQIIEILQNLGFVKTEFNSLSGGLCNIFISQKIY